MKFTAREDNGGTIVFDAANFREARITAQDRWDNGCYDDIDSTVGIHLCIIPFDPETGANEEGCEDYLSFLIDPKPPLCSGSSEHEWGQPKDVFRTGVVGGSPYPVSTYVCIFCGIYKREDPNARVIQECGKYDGSDYAVTYYPPDEESLEYIAAFRS
jgi:hypothetical protein